MANGGFIVKFDGKNAVRCYAVAFDYDEGEYRFNNEKSQKLPANLKKISIEVEEG